MANEFKAKNGVITPNVVISSNTSSTISGRLNVYGGINSDANIETGINIQSSAPATIPGVIAGSSNSILQISGGGTNTAGARGAQIDLYGGANSSGQMIIRTGNATGGTSQPERIRVTGVGNVGIGNTSPIAKLQVDGAVRFNHRTIQNLYVQLLSTDAIAGKRVQLTMPAVNYWNATVTVKASRPANDSTGQQNLMMVFDVSRTGGISGANAYFTVTNNFEDIRNSGFTRNWYFDSATGVPVLRFGQATNSYEYHVTIEFDSSNATDSSVYSTVVVDDGTVPSGVIIQPSYGMAVESGNIILKSNSAARMNFVDTNVTLGTAIRSDIAGANRTLQIERVGQASMSIIRNSNDVSGSAIILAKSRGTAIGTTVTPAGGDELGVIGFTAANGSAMPLQQVQIQSTVGANVSGVLKLRTINNVGTLADRIVIGENGTVGVGDGASLVTGAYLHVQANSTGSTQGIRVTNTNSGVAAGSRVELFNDAGQSGGIVIRSSTMADRANSTVFYSQSDVSLFSNGTEVVTVNNANGFSRVGINTITPLDTLHVAGDIRITNSNFIKSTLANGTATRLLGIDGFNTMYVGGIDQPIANLQLTASANGKMTIGSNGLTTVTTGNISDTYTTTSTTSISPSGGMVINNNTGADSSYSGIALQTKTSAGSFGRAYIGVVGGTGVVLDSHIVFGRRTGTSAYGETVRIAYDGNVGINTINPTSKLHVVGTANITGTINSGNITAPNFFGNLTGNVTGNLVITGSNTWVVFNDAGVANSTAGFTFNKTSNTVTVSGKVNTPEIFVPTINNKVQAEVSVDNLFATFNLENTIDYVGTKQSILVTTVADVAASLAGKYFIVYGLSITGTVLNIATSTEAATAIWFTVGGSGTQPTGTGAARFIPVALAVNDSAAAVASKIVTALNTDAGFSARSNSNVVTITNRVPGTYTAPAVGTSGFTVAINITGSGTLAVGTSMYASGVLATNGKIYFIPLNAGSVLVVDTVNNTSYTFGSVTTGDSGAASSRYYGGVLAKNGKIYCPPGSASKVMIIDPVTETISYIATDLGATVTKFFNGSLVPNGKIYCASTQTAGYTNLLIIDPSNDSVDTINIGVVGYGSPVLASNGKLYFPPNNATNILVVDPMDNSRYTFGSVAATTNKWFNATLAPDGMIYGIAFGVTQILKIDPIAETVTYMTGTASGYYLSGLGANGKVYAAPRSSAPLNVYDPETDTNTTLNPTNGTWATSISKWHGGVLAPNGKIYFAPADAVVILTVDSGSHAIPNWYLSAYYNKG